MAEITFEELVRVAQQLSPEQKMALVRTLETPASAALDDEPEPTRQQLIAELDALRTAGAYNNVASMRNIVANPNALSWSVEEMDTYLREIRAEWEEDLDELADDAD